MKFTNHILAGCVALMAFAGTSCVGDLDLTPNDPNTKLELTSQAEWDGSLGRIYANLYRDDIISTSDGGAGTFTRTHFNLNEIVADECFISEAWNDPGYQPLNKNQWSPDNEWIYAAFAREFFNAKMAAEFMSGMRTQGAAFFDETEVNARIAEASALRGLAYYQMIDLFGRGPWIDENSTTGATPPTYDRKQLFDAITAELEQYVPQLKPAAQQSYGRVSREAGYMLLAKLYLNAEVYTGTPMWRECAEACKQVVSTGITLAPEYKYLFCATNDKYVGNGEIIWGIPQDGTTLTTYGGTTYLSGGSYRGDSDLLKTLGVAVSGWAGPRVRQELAEAFEDGDNRRLIYEGDYTAKIENLGDQTQGYMCIKYVYTPETDYKNEAQDSPYCNTVFNPTDYPLFRLADVYLMLAECELHQATGCNGAEMLSRVRKRAGLSEVSSYTADELLRERLCELYWEGHRRSDLVRFGKFAGSEYVWSWKGGTAEGSGTQSYRNLYCIPTQFVSTLGQNDGY